MGGQSEVESEPGRGSVFRFSAALRMELLHSRMRELEVRQFGGLQLLLVSSSMELGRYLRELLKALQIRVHRSVDGEQAAADQRRAAERGETFALALVDVASVRGTHALGLPQVVILLPGQVNSLRPEAGAGTSFVFEPIKLRTLKAAIWEALQMEPVAGAPLSAAVGRASVMDCRPGRILVAEDNPVNQKVIQKFLEKLGHEALIVANGRLALEALEQGGWAAVLMDCQMPEVDGYEATARMRQAGCRLPIIALNARALPEDRKRCEQAGMNDFVANPVELECLRDTLDRWLRATSSASVPPAPLKAE